MGAGVGGCVRPKINKRAVPLLHSFSTTFAQSNAYTGNVPIYNIYRFLYYVFCCNIGVLTTHIQSVALFSRGVFTIYKKYVDTCCSGVLNTNTKYVVKYIGLCSMVF